MAGLVDALKSRPITSGEGIATKRGLYIGVLGGALKHSPEHLKGALLIIELVAEQISATLKPRELLLKGRVMLLKVAHATGEQLGELAPLILLRVEVGERLPRLSALRLSLKRARPQLNRLLILPEVLIGELSHVHPQRHALSAL